MKYRVVLISCVSKKLTHRAKAIDLYTSTIFKLNLKYARKLSPDMVFILSAKHGLVPLDKVIAPYNETLNNMTSRDIQLWAKRILGQLESVCEIDKTEFTFLAGNKYRMYLIPHLRDFKAPLKGLRIGEQLKRLKELVS